MDEFKDQIKDLYKAFSDNQKNKKGTPHKFDSHANFRGKLGVNDTGIALTPKAYKKQQRGRAGYRYPIHLQNLNERRRADAMKRHGITDINDPFNKNKKAISMIYYVHDTDGDTVFYDDNCKKIIKKVSPKKGRAVIFDSLIFHSYMRPVKSDKRVVINFIVNV